MVSVNINIDRKAVYFFVGVLILLIGAGLSVAFVGPSGVGHELYEVNMPACETGEILEKIDGGWGCGSGSGDTSTSGITWLETPIRVVTEKNFKDDKYKTWTYPEYANKIILLRGWCNEVIISSVPYDYEVGTSAEKAVSTRFCAAGNDATRVGIGTVWVDSEGRFKTFAHETDPDTSNYYFDIIAYMN